MTVKQTSPKPSWLVDQEFVQNLTGWLSRSSCICWSHLECGWWLCWPGGSQATYFQALLFWKAVFARPCGSCGLSTFHMVSLMWMLDSGVGGSLEPRAPIWKLPAISGWARNPGTASPLLQSLVWQGSGAGLESEGGGLSQQQGYRMKAIISLPQPLPRKNRWS